jgi:hypothetical protein
MSPNKDGSPMAPRAVTPTLRSNEASWEDYDEGLYGSAQKARRNKVKEDNSMEEEDVLQPNPVTIATFDDDDEDMPMDEMMAVTPRKEAPAQAKQSVLEPHESLSMPTLPNNIGKIRAALESSSFTRPEGLNLEERMLWDAVQSTIFNALRRAKTAESPPTVSSREIELDKKIAKMEAKMELLKQKARNVEINADVSSPNAFKRLSELEAKLAETEEILKTKESEHDVELRAIQRVLAEISAEREEETQILNSTVESLSNKVETLENEKLTLQRGLPPPPPPPAKNADSSELSSKVEIGKLKETIKALEAENAATRKEAERKARHASVLERDYKSVKAQLKSLEAENKGPSDQPSSPKVEALLAELAKLKERNLMLQADLDAANKDRKAKRKPLGSMTPPRPDTTSHNDCDSVASSMSAEDVESLQKNLSETTSSLENAKKIIASLENANGSMAIDLRAKLKAKEEEVALIQKESAERKRRLDSLATELRDLQKRHDDVERLQTENRAQIVRQKALMGLLEKSVSGLQAASAIHEVATATGAPDRTNTEQISEILTDAMLAIRTSLEMSEQYFDEFDDETTVAYTDVEVSSEVGRQIDAIIKNDREALAENLKNELEQKRIAVRRLEEALQKQNEEIRRLRRESITPVGNQELLDEIKNLREQCATNMETLVKKEQELSVLRSSLKVDEADGGYISDDASEGEDENNPNVSRRVDGFEPNQTELSATLLAGGGSVSEADSAFKNELLKLLEEKAKVEKELQAERDSLASAKLIISSLGKANKSMMDDLRSRLQDSNTAISSLLDQSNKHEKNSNTLREEVETLKREKERLENQLLKGTPELTVDIDPMPDEQDEPATVADGASS